MVANRVISVPKGVRLLGPSHNGFSRVRLGNIELSIPLKSSDLRIIRVRNAEVRLVEPLIRAGMKVNFSWLSDEERTTIGGSIDDYFKKFIKAKSIEGLAPKTLAGYDHMYAHLKNSLQVGRRANTLKLADIEGYKLYLVDQGLSPATCNRRLRELASFTRFLYDHEIIRRHFKVKRIREIEKINYISEDGLERILEQIPERMRPIFRLYAETGLRLMEPFHSVLFGKTLVIPSHKSKNRFVREVELNNDQVLVWKFLMTLPYKPQYYSRMFKQAAIAAGLGTNKFHNLRHFFGARLFAIHKDVQYVKLEMGHRSLSTTEKYQKFSLAQLKSAFPEASKLSKA